MRWITVVIAALLLLIQYPLWLGDGGWFKVWEREKKLAAQQKNNEELRARNAA
ncbi:MAG: septum formation initiator family protein, partial [Burkholderiales bacterium]